jgi:hypothetical protein
MRRASKYLSILIGSFIIVTLIVGLRKVDISTINYNGKYICLKLPKLVKFAALMEREEEYKAWIVTMIDTKDSNEAKIKKIFNQIKDFPTPSELEKLKENLPSKYGIIDIAQHEYQVLIKQYGQHGEQALNFCNLMAIIECPASPVSMPTALVIVRSSLDNFLYFDFDRRKMIKSGEIPDSYRKIIEKKLNELDKSSRNFFGGDYLHGYAQISWYRFQYLVLPWRWMSKMKDYLTTEPLPAY